MAVQDDAMGVGEKLTAGPQTGSEASSSQLPAAARPPATEACLEACLTEMVRYYRYAAVGRRCHGIIHNMNTPLQILSFQLEVLEHKSLEEADYLLNLPEPAASELSGFFRYRQEKLRQMRQELDNLYAMSRRLIHQAMHEDSHDKFFLDLNQLLQEELELYKGNLFFKHQVTKEVHLQADLPKVCGHYIDFSQSFRHLVDNALEAMAEAPRRVLTVETQTHEGQIWLRVGDTGGGIPSEVLPLVGQPFVTTKKDCLPSHAGLGLYMVRRLMAPYGGRLQVASQPGDTRVTVVLPG
jgi:signal transduction histidine kinase